MFGRFLRPAQLGALFLAFAAHSALAMPPAPEPPATGSAVADAIRAALADDWDRARVFVADPVAAKTLAWLRLRSSRSDATFEDARKFLADNPQWPHRNLIRRNAESLLDSGVSDTATLDWFAHDAPLTAAGAERFALALRRAGHETRATAIIRSAWIEHDMPEPDAERFRNQYQASLRREDHIARLDRLLWDGRAVAARAQARRLGEGYPALAEARLKLMRSEPGVDAAIARVPKALADDPGLTFERLRWRRQKGFTEGAQELLARKPEILVRPASWWRERAILTRRAFADGRITDAYRLASNHRQSEGYGFAESEWMAGWLALRFLRDPQTALAHFERLYEGVRYPVSLARAAYWAGRAAAAAGKVETADRWYELAAGHSTTFYGQLAAAERGTAVAPPPDPEIAPAARKAFAENDLARAARLFAELGERNLSSVFLRALAASAKAPGDWALAAAYAADIGRPDVGVDIAKNALQEGIVLSLAGYPVLDRVPGPDADRGLVHAVVRQESLFDTNAISRAGARGLMQLMPPTAAQVARRLGVSHHTARLLEDPGHNLLLGTTYLAQLIEEFDGSVVLAVAGYNAGPARARRWARELGDPRGMSLHEVIDWIESIPFTETRNYIQRVLENATIYAVRLGGRYDPANLKELLRPAELAQSSR